MRYGPGKAETTRSCWYANRLPFTRRHVGGGVFDCEIADDRPGMIVLKVYGHGASQRFKPESGGHRWQRVPPTEKSGRVQSSTVTVAVMQVPASVSVAVRESDCEIMTCRGSGPGGQKRNKTETAVQIRHKPSGLMVRCDQERSQQQNRVTAMANLAAKLHASASSSAQSSEREKRKCQVGSGERSDKIRTVQIKNGVVFSSGGRKMRLADYMKGLIEQVQD